MTAIIPSQRDEGELGRETWPLVERAQAGDRDAFGELYRLYHPDVRAFITWRMSGPSRRDAEDLTSVVFTRAFARIGAVQYRGRDIGAWLITIARNVVADHYKSSYSRLTSLVSEVHDIDYADEDGSHREATRRELRDEIEAALAELTPEQARVIRLRFLDELSVAEASAVMGLTDGAVKALTSRATARLRRSQRLAAHR